MQNATDQNTEHSIYSDKGVERQVATGLAALDKLAGGVIQVNELFADREDGGNQVLKPPHMSVQELALHAAKQAKAEAEMVEFSKTFLARPNDGGVAFAQVLKNIFGITAIGKTQYSMFGAQRPEYKSVIVGYNEDGTSQSVEVPWGLMEFSPLEAQFTLQYTMDVDYGFCFHVSVEAPKKNRERINALFSAVEEYLKRNSIYKGKALHGVGRANPNTGQIIEPEFISDLYVSERSKIVYTEQVTRALEYSMFGVIKNAEALRRAGQPIGEKILLWGPNGSGKTEAATHAMQHAVENGWTAIRARYDEDLHKVIKFAERVGSPTVVVVEDCEKLMVPANADVQEMDKLLDLFDGAGAKGREVMLVMTSNHVHELTRSMTRPGRINRLINVADLDREAFERLFKVLVTEERLNDVDFDRLFEAFPECAPVWVVEAINRAEKSVIIRTGHPGDSFVTDDFLYEAEGLGEHLQIHRTAADRPAKETIGEAFIELVIDGLRQELPTYRLNQNDQLRLEKLQEV